MKSAVILVSSYWHTKYHARKVNELLKKSFTQEAMYEDMDRVSKMLSLCKVQKHRMTDRRTGTSSSLVSVIGRFGQFRHNTRVCSQTRRDEGGPKGHY